MNEAEKLQTIPKRQNDRKTTTGILYPKPGAKAAANTTLQPRPKQEPRKDPHKMKKGTRNA